MDTHTRVDGATEVPPDLDRPATRAGDQGRARRDDQARLLPRTDHAPVRPHQAGRGVVQEQSLVGALRSRSVHRRCAVLWVSRYVRPAARGVRIKHLCNAQTGSTSAFPPRLQVWPIFVLLGLASLDHPPCALPVSEPPGGVVAPSVGCDAHAHAAAAADSSDAAR